MKRVITVLLSLMMVAVLSLSLVGCELTLPDGGGSITAELTKLYAPTNVRVENDIIRWNSASNANGYVVSINGQEDSTTELSYPISNIVYESAQLNIRVKSRGNNIVFSDSDWSAFVTYDYIKKSTDDNSGNTTDPDDQNPSKPSEISIATDYGIGYGYNVINSPYFESGEVKKTSILNLSKASEYIRTTNQSNSLSGGIYAESIEDYTNNFSQKLNIGFDISGGWSVFSSSLNISFDINQLSKFSSSDKQVYYSYFDNINAYYYEMKNYNIDVLRSMLSDLFLAALNRQTSSTRNLSDEALAYYLIDNFGTHLITGIQMGGRIEYSYLLNTSDMDVYNNLEWALNTKFSAGVTGIVSGSVTDNVQGKVEETLHSSNVRSTTTIRTFGGAHYGLWNEEQLKENYGKWVESLNDDSNLNAVGIAPDGMVALWSLLPEEEQYKNIALEMEAIFERTGLAAYNGNIEKYHSYIQEDVESTGVVEVNLKDYYKYTSNSNTAIALQGFYDEFYDDTTGIFTLYGSKGGNIVNTYKIIGNYGGYNSQGQVIRTVIKGLSFRIFSEHDITIEFENMAFIASAGNPAIYSADQTENKNITITLVGSGIENVFYGCEQTANKASSPAINIDVAKLIITGNSSINAYGGTGKDGAVVDSYGSGEDGGDGAVGMIIGGEVDFDTNSTVTITGGNGGSGHAGSSGANGVSSSSYGVKGGNGGNGGYGGDGGRGAQGLVMTIGGKISVLSGNVSVRNGNGGNGGDGGAGGNGGNGYKGRVSLKSKTSDWDNGSAGGDGGNGGWGGDGGSAVTEKRLSWNLSITTGASFTETVGRYGNGGKGGKGGNGGDGGAGGQNNGTYYVDTPAGNIGGDGGKGGNGGYGGDGYASGNGGLGGDGGKGGAKGSNISFGAFQQYTSTGTAGKDGSNGTYGLVGTTIR